MHGGVCMARGHAWQVGGWGVCGRGACVVGVCVAGGHAWSGACMAGGVCGGGHAWQILRDTVNERAVRILLECILGLLLFLHFMYYEFLKLLDFVMMMNYKRLQPHHHNYHN